MKRKIVLSWSGGKDSALALETLLDAGEYDIAALLSGFIEGEGRLIMHEVRQELIARQADALGISLAPFYLPRGAPNAVYENRLLARLAPLRAQGVTGIAFGDLFLQDIRGYREKLFAGSGFEPLFPIWREDAPDSVCAAGCGQARRAAALNGLTQRACGCSRNRAVGQGVCSRHARACEAVCG